MADTSVITVMKPGCEVPYSVKGTIYELELLKQQQNNKIRG